MRSFSKSRMFALLLVLGAPMVAPTSLLAPAFAAEEVLSPDLQLALQQALQGSPAQVEEQLLALIEANPVQAGQIMTAAMLQALYGSFMTLSGLEYGFLAEKTEFRGVATGTFNARNMLAGHLELCLACGLGLLVSTLGRGAERNWGERLRLTLDAMLGARMRLRIYLALMVIALVLTRSRMGNTAFFSALLVCGFLYMLLQGRVNRSAIVLFASLLLVDFLIVGQWFGFEELAARLENTSMEVEDRDEQFEDALLIHSLVDFNLQIPANALLFVFMLALGWMARRHDWAPEGEPDSAT